ncbi:MAG: disulfide bond formation protein B [Candidatus Paceibacterota bacterium]
MFYLFSALHTLNFLLALGGLVLLVVTIGLYVDYFLYQSRYFIRWFQQYIWITIIVTTAGSVALSLLYSEFYGFVPCSLCWLQRIALYPQALFAIMAFKTKESIYFPLYSIALSIIGLGVAMYHYVYQMIPSDVGTAGILPCLADGSSDCATRVIDEFGFVTFPLLSAITFAFLIILYLNLRRS